MNNLLQTSGEFEQKPNQEVEQKFIPLFPEQLDTWREASQPIEQMYLSHPSEAYSLRLRESFGRDGNPIYTATLKDRGETTKAGLKRLEIETNISAETYALYRANDVYPVLQKLRTSPVKNIDIDFYSNGDVTLESEHPISLTSFLGKHPIALDERTGDKSVDNEHRAHFDYRKNHGGNNTLVPIEQSDVGLSLTREIYQHHINNRLVVATIHGRSGSGKSSLVREIANELKGVIPRIITISTDDYHVGKTFLEAHNNGQPWQDWDAEIVYDIDALAADLEALKNGESVHSRTFNFITQEPEITGVIEPINDRTLILLEGIYAGSNKLDSAADVRHEVQTPLATSIGRRIARDFSGERVNDSLPDPEVVLRYLIENAEPAYQAQK
ncbi:MAG: hypothetical protein EOO17_01145, partial [Chloroflexi bacterium]